jgi:hypothetical protein
LDNVCYFRQFSRKCEHENFCFNSTTKPSWHPYIVTIGSHGAMVKFVFCLLYSVFYLQHFFSGSFFQYSLLAMFFFYFYFFGLFRNICVCFSCFETDPKHQNKPKKLLLVSRNKPKINQNRLSFGLFRFEPKKKFVRFEDTLPLGFDPELCPSFKPN